jgi:diguanylate cyclase (GGDEF)-like protein
MRNENPVRILVADDDAITRLTLKILLSKRGYDVVTACDGHEAYNLLQQGDAPRLAILDWMMPGLDGVELCRKLRESGSAPYTYIVMLSGKCEKNDFIAGLQAGANDYVKKPYDIDELVARMQAAQRIVTLQDDLRSKANEDQLTGVLSRGAIIEILRRELAHKARDGKPVSVIFVDLDNFKRVNDTHGHPVGDVVLREVSRLLGTQLRAYDAVGRYGGEEFLIVLPGCPSANALDVAERVRRAVADAPVNTAAGLVAMTISLGVATTGAQSGGPDELVLAADKALYFAKLAGRNRVEGSAEPSLAQSVVPTPG